MKKITLLISVTLLFITSCNSQNKKSENFLPVKMNNGLYGYINHKGDSILKPQYELAKKYSENLACVRMKRKFGYINEQGDIVIKPIFRKAGDFKDGFAKVTTNEGKHTYVKKDGQLLNQYFDMCYPFKDGMGRIEKYGSGYGSTYGFVNKNGEIAIEPKYENVGDFYNGLALVKINSNFGYINKLGEIAIEPKYYSATKFKEGLAAVRDTESKTKYINTKGEVVLEIDSYYIGYNFSDGLAMFNQKGKKGHGFVNKKGEIVIKPDDRFEAIDNFNEGVARFFTKTETGFINTKGEIVFKVKKNIALGEVSEGMILFQVKDDNLSSNNYGYMNLKGEIVIKPQFQEAERFVNGVARVVLKNSITSRYIDKSGKFIYIPGREKHKFKDRMH